MVMFQFPSTAIALSPGIVPCKTVSGYGWRYSASPWQCPWSGTVRDDESNRCAVGALVRDGNQTTRPLETCQPAQASGQGIEAPVARTKAGCTGKRETGRPALSQSGGQHARGIEAEIEGNRQKGSKEEKPQADGARTKDPGPVGRERPAGRLDRGGPPSFRQERRIPLEAGRHQESRRDDTAGRAAQGQLGGSLLRPREARTAGGSRWQADTLRALGAC